MDLFDRAPQAKVAPASGRAAVPDHHCVVCGVWAGFGFDVFLRQGKPGRWACRPHRDQVERMAA